MGEDVSKIKGYLNDCAWFNDGHGLILPPHLADDLKALGIAGPFHVQQPIPLTDDDKLAGPPSA